LDNSERIFLEEDIPAAVFYAILLALVLLASVAALKRLGKGTSQDLLNLESEAPSPERWMASAGSELSRRIGVSSVLSTSFLHAHSIRNEFLMRKLTSAILRFVVDESGPTAVEYAVMLALIIVVCLLAIQNIGKSASQTFQAVANSMGT
jgi:pilus assembly protein Flp/PilA